MDRLPSPDTMKRANRALQQRPEVPRKALKAERTSSPRDEHANILQKEIAKIIHSTEHPLNITTYLLRIHYHKKI